MKALTAVSALGVLLLVSCTFADNRAWYWPWSTSRSDDVEEPELRPQEDAAPVLYKSVPCALKDPLDRTFLLIPHPNERRGYYSFSPELHKCPFGLKYNAEKQLCDWPRAISAQVEQEQNDPGGTDSENCDATDPLLAVGSLLLAHPSDKDSFYVLVPNLKYCKPDEIFNGNKQRCVPASDCSCPGESSEEIESNENSNSSDENTESNSSSDSSISSNSGSSSGSSESSEGSENGSGGSGSGSGSSSGSSSGSGESSEGSGNGSGGSGSGSGSSSGSSSGSGESSEGSGNGSGGSGSGSGSSSGSSSGSGDSGDGSGSGGNGSGSGNDSSSGSNDVGDGSSDSNGSSGSVGVSSDGSGETSEGGGNSENSGNVSGSDGDSSGLNTETSESESDGSENGGDSSGNGGGDSSEGNGGGSGGCNDECPAIGKCPAVDPITYTVHLPHKYDCGLFCRCDHGIAKLDRCPPGLHFNPVLEVCDWPANAGCVSENAKFVFHN